MMYGVPKALSTSLNQQHFTYSSDSLLQHQYAINAGLKSKSLVKNTLGLLR